MQQRGTGNVCAALVIDDLDLSARDDHIADVLERHVQARCRIVEAAVRVLPDQMFFHPLLRSHVTCEIVGAASRKIIRLKYALHNARDTGPSK